jgi:putative zinc finger/helix-turn-helix YgiT family protein
MASIKAICPICGKETELKETRRKEEINVRGEKITVEKKYEECLKCGEYFEDITSEEDPNNEAYREFRKRHDMLQPEEIRELREKYNLTQSELSKLLGFGGATISRYENGALQDGAHDIALKQARRPNFLLGLIESNEKALRPKKKAKLLKTLREEGLRTYAWDNLFDELFLHQEADDKTGYKKLDLEKLYAAIIYLCKEGVFKTVLNKLLFYVDFKHFKEYGTSITGARYAHLTYGPGPDKYDFFYTALKEEGLLRSEEVVYKNIAGEKLFPNQEPDLSVFTPGELKTLALVKEKLQRVKAVDLSGISHREIGYKETVNGQTISYNYADDLIAI